jgi:multidrug transporter EmrE-like cation transporter
MAGYSYIFGTIVFTVAGQLLLKWRVGIKQVPEPLIDKLWFLIGLIFTDGFVFFGFCSAFVASVFWMAAMTKFPISYAYPFMTIALALVVVGSNVLLGEKITSLYLFGFTLIVAGLIVLTKAT